MNAPYIRGMLAWWLGYSFRDNPYIPGSYERYEWSQGYLWYR